MNRRILLTLVATTALSFVLLAIIRRRRRADRDDGPLPVTGEVHMAVGDEAPEPAKAPEPPETAESEVS